MSNQYHHGGLKPALIEQVIKSLNTEEVHHISLRELARQLNVSQAAIYRHFKSKEMLLDAVAQEGYRRFDDYLEKYSEINFGKISFNLKEAFVFFSIENPEVFKMMMAKPRNLDFHIGMQDIKLFKRRLTIGERNLMKLFDSNITLKKTSDLPGLCLVFGLSALILNKRILVKRFSANGTENFVQEVLSTSKGL